MGGFSRGKPEAGRNDLGLCTARYESKGCCSCVLKAYLGFLAEFGGVLYADHGSISERLPTL